MSTRELVIEYLVKHRGPQLYNATEEEMSHFVNLLIDVADYVIQKKNESTGH